MLAKLESASAYERIILSNFLANRRTIATGFNRNVTLSSGSLRARAQPCFPKNFIISTRSVRRCFVCPSTRCTRIYVYSQRRQDDRTACLELKERKGKIIVIRSNAIEIGTYRHNKKLYLLKYVYGLWNTDIILLCIAYPIAVRGDT